MVVWRLIEDYFLMNPKLASVIFGSRFEWRIYMANWRIDEDYLRFIEDEFEFDWRLFWDDRGTQSLSVWLKAQVGFLLNAVVSIIGWQCAQGLWVIRLYSTRTQQGGMMVSWGCVATWNFDSTSSASMVGHVLTVLQHSYNIRFGAIGESIQKRNVSRYGSCWGLHESYLKDLGCKRDRDVRR